MVGRRRTSIRLETTFWLGLEEILEREDITLRALVTRIDAAQRGGNNLSSAVRVFILSYFFELTHRRAPHVPPGYEWTARR
ncbi:ribbon-helix-helix domain-containing protein [Mycobacterium sp. KBS0706]|uniref:ribbon-helix-helix domain-containing protein n=1 Tax=Mycobacterium sp. KBS0706 TaxID=2578109 RepID=UPI0035A173D6